LLSFVRQDQFKVAKPHDASVARGEAEKIFNLRG
jgi:hypothetical protein